MILNIIETGWYDYVIEGVKVREKKNILIIVSTRRVQDYRKDKTKSIYFRRRR